MGGEEQKRHLVQTKRYAIRMQPDFEWTIYDVFTGEVAKPSTWPLIDLPLERRRTSIATC